MTSLFDVVLIVLLSVGAIGARRHHMRRRSERRAKEASAAALPDIAELAALMLGAGAGVGETVRWLADRGPDATRTAFTDVVAQTEAGVTLAAALPTILNRLGPYYGPVVSALVGAVRDGVPTASLLLRLGDEARSARRQRQEQRARALSVHSVFPVVFCSLPALLITTVVPLALVALGRL